jgi:hypothetical protein
MVAAERNVVAENILAIGAIGHDAPLTPGIFDNPPPAHPKRKVVFILAGHHTGFAAGTDLGIQIKGRSMGHLFHD